MILARDDHLSFSIYNRGFDQQEFFVQDRFTLNMWIKALQQHIVDMYQFRINNFVADFGQTENSKFLLFYLKIKVDL